MNKLEENTAIKNTPAQPAKTEQDAAPATQETQRKAEMPKHHNKKIAYAAFHATNFLGFHVLFNSTVSLFIAYNLLPTKPVKATMEFMAKVAAPVNAAFSKVTTPLFKFVRGNSYKELSSEEVAAKIAHSARSRVETAFMCIAGFLALWPVKWLEDHRAEFMNTVDHVVHPFRSKAERKAQEIKPEDTPKETWGNLIRARIIGLAAVFSVDALQQRFNNFLTYEKGNIDTAVWKWGAKIFDKMPEKIRDRFVEFFTRKEINLSGIQSDMIPHLLRVVDGHPDLHDLGTKLADLQNQIKRTPHKAEQIKLKEEISTTLKKFDETHPGLKTEVERAIFAEQSRLLITKELFLTLLISTVIYICAKTPIAHKMMEKAHLAKKSAEEPKPLPSSPPDPLAETIVTAPSHGSETINHAQGRNIKPIDKHRKIKPQPFAERMLQEAEMANTQQLTV